MQYPELAEQILEMQKRDDAFREKLIQNKTLSDGYHPKMECIHSENAESLQHIIDKIGFPTIEKVGNLAYKASWLIIQHAISKPKFMKNALTLAQKIPQKDFYTQQRIAFLTDRILVYEEKPQRYGTQFDWDENGTLNPAPFDELNAVNERRKKLGMNSLESQTEFIQTRTQKENQSPPKDLKAYKNAQKQWKQKVGWI